MGGRRYGAVLSLLTRRPRDVPTLKTRTRGADRCGGYHVVRCNRDQPEELGGRNQEPAGREDRAAHARGGGCRGPQELRRSRAEWTLGQAVAVRVCHETGYEGFWLDRTMGLETMGLETMVLDPASLLAHDRGDAAVLSRGRVPSVEEEDRKRLLRERQRLVKEHTALTNAIKGLLKLHGIFDLESRAGDFDAAFAAVTTAYNRSWPAVTVAALPGRQSQTSSSASVGPNRLV